MKLSIIIPVYRTQDTLERCLESILQQSFTDYEMILVDDGSDDGSPQLCDEYARKDARIRVIHKENGGLSDARNAGIRKARGEYITFVDSDDTMVDNTLENLIQEIGKHPHVDILEYSVSERYGNRKRQSELSFTPAEYQNPLDYWFAEKGYQHTYAWNKIYRRHLFDDVEFPKGRTFEDAWTTPLLIGLVSDRKDEKAFPVIRVTDIGKYVYHWNNRGITAQAKYGDLKSLYDAHIRILTSIMHRFKAHPAYMQQYGEQLQDYMAQILNIMLDLYDVSGKLEPSPPLMEYLAGIDKGIHPFKLQLLKILGYQRLCKVNHLIHQILCLGRKLRCHW